MKRSPSRAILRSLSGKTPENTVEDGQDFLHFEIQAHAAGFQPRKGVHDKGVRSWPSRGRAIALTRRNFGWPSVPQGQRCSVFALLPRSDTCDMAIWWSYVKQKEGHFAAAFSQARDSRTRFVRQHEHLHLASWQKGQTCRIVLLELR